MPFTRFMGRELLHELRSDSLYLEPRERLEQVFTDVIDDLWADPDRLPQSAAVLATLRRLIDDLYPPGGAPHSELERQAIAERTVEVVYEHSLPVQVLQFRVFPLLSVAVGMVLWVYRERLGLAARAATAAPDASPPRPPPGACRGA